MNPSADSTNPLPPEGEPSTQDEVAPDYASDDPLRVLGSQFYTLTPGEPGSTQTNDPPLLSPTAEIPWPKIPGYEILRELGRGGMGVVYQAKHLSLKRTVALKMILAGSAAGEEMLHRFRQEAQIIAELDHPNIVQVYDCGEWEGKAYISLEYISGPSLKDLLGKPLPPRDAAELMALLADTMGAVHDRQIVHRDLKPANILLKKRSEVRSAKSVTVPPADLEKARAAGKPVAEVIAAAVSAAVPSEPPLSEYIPKVTDFGIAKKLDGLEGQTRTGMVLGSPHYMAPEQVEGRIREIGPTTDVFALGGMLYEMLSGHPPFEAESLYALMGKITKTEPASLRKQEKAIPKKLEAICLKCLRKRPAERYPTAAELAVDLTQLLVDEWGVIPGQSPKTSAATTMLRFKEEKKPNYLLYALALVAVLAVAGIAGFFWSRRGDTAVVQNSSSSHVAPSSSEPPLSPRETASAIVPTSTGDASTPVQALAKRLTQLKADLEADAAVNDEKEFLNRAKALLEYQDDVLDAPLLTYKAEYLLERERRLAEAEGCLAKAATKEPLAGKHSYVDARLKWSKQPSQPEAAATTLARVDHKHLVGFRARQALEVYEAAAHDWSSKLTVDAAALGQPPRGAPAWLPHAEALCSHPSQPLLLDLTLLFAWTSPMPKVEHLNLLLDKPSAVLTRRPDSAILLAELHRRRAELRKTADPVAAVKDYHQAFQRIKEVKDAKLPATAKCEKLLQPVLAWVDSNKPQLDDPARRQIADLFAAKGEMIFREPFPAQGTWPSDDPYREGSLAYGKALEFLPAKAEAVLKSHYHTQKGLCLSKLGQAQLTIPEIQEILKDATEATQLNPKAPDAFALQGTALYLQAVIDQSARFTRRVEERFQRVQQGLQQSEAAYTEALKLGQGTQSTETLSTWHANRGGVYSFWAGVLREEGRLLEANPAAKAEATAKYAEAKAKYDLALKDGQQAVAYNGESETAFGTLGVAYMLYAFSLKPGSADFKENLKKAEEALKKQVDLRPTQEQGRVTLGLFYANCGVFAKADENRPLMQEYHGKARKYLEEVTKLNANHPEANYWLGFLVAKEENYDEAAKYLIKSLQDPKFLRYNLENRIGRSFPAQDLEKILFSPKVSLAEAQPADRAAWLVLQAVYRLGQQEKKLEASLVKQEKPEAGLLGPIKEAMGYLEQIGREQLPNPTIPSLARDIGVRARLLAARLPDVPKEKRLPYLHEAETLLEDTGGTLTPAVDQQWEALADTAWDLAQAGPSNADQLKELFKLAEDASRKVDQLTKDDKLKKRMKQLREDIPKRRNTSPK